MSAALAVQKAIRERLVGTAAVTALVPAANILDRNSRPAPDPSIIIGEDQEVDEGQSIARDVVRVFSTLHVWKREPGLTGVKAIAGAVRAALMQANRITATGYHVADCYVSGSRFLRDPDGETAHGVITVETLVKEA